MNKVLHLGATVKALEEDEDGYLNIKGFASTVDKDRAGDIITADAWSNGGLSNYLKNPILLFNHNHNEPIGTATKVEATANGLEIEGKVSAAAGRVAGLIKDGILRTFSVGFMIKDGKYISQDDTFYITDVELFEVSVVSVPCNQDAVFSVAKSFGSEEEYKNYVKQFVPAEQLADSSANAQDSAGDTASNKELEMDAEELKKLLEDATEKASKSTLDAIQKAEEERKAKEEEERKAKEAKEAETAAVAQVVKETSEKLMEDVEKRFSEKNEELSSIVGNLQEELKEKSSEITRMRESKREFADRGTTDVTKLAEEAVDAKLLGVITKKGWDTDYGKQLVEKVNTMSSADVYDNLEEEVTTNIERDIQKELILAPMFREIQMNSASMTLPIMPDAGYAKFISTRTDDTAIADDQGSLSERGGTNGDGVTLSELTLQAKKLMSVSYLANDTDEDVIIPLLPLIREAMIRSHARAVEGSLLMGGHTDAPVSGSFDGLVQLATADSDTTSLGATGFATADSVTSADLVGLRQKMGKYGHRPEEVVYIVSQDVYYDLLTDSEFEDANLVGELATKVKGSVGRVYGSQVVVCDEFPAKAAGKANAIAVNARNYIIPRLRGITLETDYETTNQRLALVATQRLGFSDIIDAATSKWSLTWKGA